MSIINKHPLSRRKVLEAYLGWDDVIRRWKDTRTWIKPLRITFEEDGEVMVLYLYAKEEGTAIYGKENERLYEKLR